MEAVHGTDHYAVGVLAIDTGLGGDVRLTEKGIDLVKERGVTQTGYHSLRSCRAVVRQGPGVAFAFPLH